MLSKVRLSPLIAATALLASSFTQVVLSVAPGTDGMSLGTSDWPWWRGTQRDGIIDNQSLPLEWSETKNVLWKAPIPGRGHGSPIIVGERVFLATADEDKESQYVICLDRVSGKTLWNEQIHQGGWQDRIDKKKYTSFIYIG